MTDQYLTTLLDTQDAVSTAVELLKQGECVALPSETVYGLAADASKVEAVNKIFDAKGRPKNHPLIVHLPSAEHLIQWATDIPKQAYELAEHFWPGPLTLLLKKAPHVPTAVTGGLDTIAVRVPAHSQFLQVLKTFAGGLAAPSANRYKQLSPTTSEQVMQGLNGRIPAVLEGGHCAHGLESTIVDLLGESPRVLRPGPITPAQLQQVLAVDIQVPEQFQDSVPGNVEAHYRPQTPLHSVTTEQLQGQLADYQSSNVILLLRSQALIEQVEQSYPAIKWQRMPNNATGFGKELYATLFNLDQLGADKIVLETPPNTDDWRAVNNRLSRAVTPLPI